MPYQVLTDPKKDADTKRRAEIKNFTDFLCRLVKAAAPDAICQGDKFVKATHSDNGYVIIGLNDRLPNRIFLMANG